MLRQALVFLALLAAPAAAQLGNAVGKPLPSPDLPDGTVVVRVTDGSFAAPHPHQKVTLLVNGKARTAETNEAGRVTFDHVAAGAKVQASISKDKFGTSETFEAPASGGVRVMLSTKPWSEPARQLDGHAEQDDLLRPREIEVRVTYDNLSDPKPPEGVMVSLVADVATDSCKVTQQKADAHGVANFTALDATGTVAYYALAALTRKPGADRLLSEGVVLDASPHGKKIVLSGEQRTASAPPIDD